MSLELNKVHLGDCLEILPTLPDKSIDMVLCDPPYQTTACKWDRLIPLEPMWEQLRRVVKDNGAIVLTASQPFTSKLVMSNPKMYRHKWVWNKNNSAGFATVKIRPFDVCEDIIVFGKNRVNYYPQMEERGKPRRKDGYSKSENYGLIPSKSKTKNNLYYPKNLLNFSNASQKGKVHPTQKPVALFEYLINTYTKEGETVLDFAIGSGTTAVACINTKRNYIGIEKEPEYHAIALERINQAKSDE